MKKKQVSYGIKGPPQCCFSELPPLGSMFQRRPILKLRSSASVYIDFSARPNLQINLSRCQHCGAHPGARNSADQRGSQTLPDLHLET